MNIPFILEKVLSLYADKEGIVCSGKRFTYGQFGERVFQLSRLFTSLGVKERDRIAILHRNSHYYLEVYFAAAQTGAILNPLNYRLSPGELDFILTDSGATILIVEDVFRESVEVISGMQNSITHILWTDTVTGLAGFESLMYDEAIAGERSDFLPSPDLEDNEIVHLYYTSGTTGKPKGVMLSHKNVCTHALAAIAELNITDHDVWIHAAPLFHLADAWASFAVTLAGGKHAVVPEFDPSDVLTVIEKERVSITNMVPTMLNMLVHTPDVDAYNLTSLRAILSGGAPIAPEVVKKIMDTFHCDYIQTYGMTETSPYLTLSILKENLTTLSSEEQFVFKAKTGRPFLGVLLRVVGEDGRDVAQDEKDVGEIIVKGDIVTQGYWNRPEETAKAIRNGWLHTGDLAVVDSQGYVNIVDRKKDMIVTGGENVYSIEVENALYTHPAVLEAAVIGVPDKKWGEAVEAYVVLKPGYRITEDEVIRHCKEQIAHYKAPKSVAFIDELPKTGSGKILKQGLKEG